MASDQKCVSGDGSPSESKYERPRKTYHQFWNQKSEGTTSGRSLVSSGWLKSTQSAVTTTTTSTMAGNRRRTRRSQNCGRLTVPVSSSSAMSRPVMR